MESKKKVVFSNINDEYNSEFDEIERLENLIYPPQISPVSIKKILKSIRSVIKYSIVIDYDNYLNIIYHGLTEQLKNSLNDIIFSELNLVTSKKRCEWCSDYSYDLTNIVDITIRGLIDCSKINIFTEKELADYIYKIIKFNIKLKFNTF